MKTKQFCYKDTDSFLVNVKTKIYFSGVEDVET